MAVPRPGFPIALGYNGRWATKPKLAGGHLLIDHWYGLTVQANKIQPNQRLKPTSSGRGAQ